MAVAFVASRKSEICKHNNSEQMLLLFSNSGKLSRVLVLHEVTNLPATNPRAELRPELPMKMNEAMIIASKHRQPATYQSDRFQGK